MGCENHADHQSPRAQPIPKGSRPRGLVLASGVALRAAPASDHTPIHLQADIVYKTTAAGELHLDLFYPATELVGAYPLVVYTHGGGWAAGSKNKAQGRSNIARTVRGLTEAGFCVAAVQYRLCKNGNTSIRDCVTDSMDAVRYLAKQGEALHLDASRVFTYGDSAGGQLAQMLLLTQPDDFPGAAELAGQRYTMRAGVSWYGPCDFEKTELFNHDGRAKFRDRFGPRVLKSDTPPADKLGLYREVSPVNYLLESWNVATLTTVGVKLLSDSTDVAGDHVLLFEIFDRNGTSVFWKLVVVPPE